MILPGHTTLEQRSNRYTGFMLLLCCCVYRESLFFCAFKLGKASPHRKLPDFKIKATF